MELWIARDLDGTLCLFKNKPVVVEYPNVVKTNNKYWRDMQEDAFAYLKRDEFPKVTFENSPQQVEINLKK